MKLSFRIEFTGPHSANVITQGPTYRYRHPIEWETEAEKQQEIESAKGRLTAKMESFQIEYKQAQDLTISVVDNEIIRGYMKRIEQGESVEPVRVLGARVKDGNHRAAAYKLLGLDVPTVPHETVR